jgi:protein-disulfide isomerase
MVQLVDGDHVRGLSDAPATVLVYGDYECPYTRALELSLARLRSLEPNGFRSVYRFFPLREIHPHAQNAAEAAEAVFALRGADAFWLMHDGLFAHQNELDESGLERRGEEAGVDAASLRAAVEAHRYADRIERDLRSGEANGVDGTPYIFINGELYPGDLDVASLRDALAGKPSHPIQPAKRARTLLHRATPHG